MFIIFYFIVEGNASCNCLLCVPLTKWQCIPLQGRLRGKKPTAVVETRTGTLLSFGGLYALKSPLDGKPVFLERAGTARAHTHTVTPERLIVQGKQSECTINKLTAVYWLEFLKVSQHRDQHIKHKFSSWHDVNFVMLTHAYSCRVVRMRPHALVGPCSWVTPRLSRWNRCYGAVFNNTNVQMCLGQDVSLVYYLIIYLYNLLSNNRYKVGWN